MSLILDEYTYAENLLRGSDLGERPSETLVLAAKYFRANNKTTKEVKGELMDFILRCRPGSNAESWERSVDWASSVSAKYGAVRIDRINITKEEMKKIKELKGVQLRRLAFTLLCSAKYWDAANEKNNHWVNTEDKEVMRMANLNVSIKKQSEMFAKLRDSGFVKFSKKIDNLNMQVLFVLPGETALSVYDFRNLGFQYMAYYGGPYFECQKCGITTKEKNPKTGRKQKYCPECAYSIKLAQSVESVMRGKYRFSGGVVFEQ